jgi:hypothetical protein
MFVETSIHFLFLLFVTQHRNRSMARGIRGRSITRSDGRSPDRTVDHQIGRSIIRSEGRSPGAEGRVRGSDSSVRYAIRAHCATLVADRADIHDPAHSGQARQRQHSGWLDIQKIMMKDHKMKNVTPRKAPGQNDAHRKSALERSVKNMKLIIAALSVALVACIVYIVSLPAESAQPRNPMNGSVPSAAQQSAPVTTPQGSGSVSDAPATAEQNPATAPPTPAPATTTPAPAPAGQMSGKINPPHGEPGHRCDIAVGAVLP